jgi:hypothetical protein
MSSALTYFQTAYKKYPCLIEFESLTSKNDVNEMLTFARVLNQTLMSGYTTYRYFFNVRHLDNNNNDNKENNQNAAGFVSDHSKIFGVHRECSDDDISQYSYLLHDDDGSLEDAQAVCEESGQFQSDMSVNVVGGDAGQHDSWFNRHCTIFTYKGKGRGSFKVADRCTLGQCM